MATVWIFGRNFEPFERGKWEFMGAFSSEQKAVNATVLSDRDWIAPTKLDEKWPDKTIVMPDAHFPRNQNDSRYAGEPDG